MVVTSPPNIPQNLLDANRIHLDKQGVWHHDGHEITHERTIDLFNRSIDWDADGNFYLRTGSDIMPIEVDDVPYRVIEVHGDPENGFELVLSDASTEKLEPMTLRVGQDDALYCTVKDGAVDARFTRASHNWLAKFIESDNESESEFILPVHGERYQVANQ